MLIFKRYLQQTVSYCIWADISHMFSKKGDFTGNQILTKPPQINMIDMNAFPTIQHNLTK